MAEEKKYRVQKVDENEPAPMDSETAERKIREMEPMPASEINMGTVALSFFVILCAAGFAAWLVRRAVLGGGAAARVFCVLLAVFLAAVIFGMTRNCLQEFKEKGRRGAYTASVLLFVLAVALGIAAGLSWMVLLP